MVHVSSGKKQITLIEGDCVEILDTYPFEVCTFDVIFADPPDNIGFKYKNYSDNLPEQDYLYWIETCLDLFIHKASCIWLSFHSKWTLEFAEIVLRLTRHYGYEFKPCVQTFTFGQHNQHDLANCHRPLWRMMRPSYRLNPDAARIPSWRQEHNDPRADPRGRVPGDVFDFPRVTGNSKQRRKWHSNQLHEGLVERCLRLTTNEKSVIMDPFCGSGTTLRVAKKLGLTAYGIEIDRYPITQMVSEWGDGLELILSTRN